MTKEIKQKKQDLGIFYTDQRIANFIFDILKIWKDKEEKESGRWESRKHFPSVIDPAVGEGVFLKAALEQKFTTPKYVFGVDIDEDVKKKWIKINLLKSFGSRAELNNHFYYQNGLLSLDEDKVFRHKKGGLKEFDAVVSNPPYGGVGLGETELTDDLVAQLASFEILPENVKNNLIVANTQRDLFNSDKQLAIKPDAKQRIKSFSIEILFLERFIQLAKPGGWIAVIIPDGILTNSNSHYVREFISEKAKVEAIVSLPRDAFKNVGTSAKTSILFLRKYKDQGKKQDNYPVFLALVDSLDEKNFNFIKDAYQKYYNKTMSNKNLVQTTTDEKGREIVMVRVDKTLKEMMEEKPASRWDPKYWHSKYDELFLNLKTEKLGNYIKDVQGGGGGSHFSAFLGDKWDEKSKYATYLHISALMDTGLNWVDAKYIDKKTYERLKTKQLQEDDILLSNKGTVGKSVVVPREFPRTVVGDTRVIRVKEINPYYVCIYFKTFFGLSLSERHKSGVASEGTTVDQLYEFDIPCTDKAVQKNIETEHKKMSKYHDKAMEAKKNNNDTEYKKNIEIAEKMLKDLIAKTEAVIRDERKDVI